MFKLLLSAGLLASSVGIAQAAPKCPSGQIYRITKKVCVDKATAIRDGVLNTRETRSTKRIESRANQGAQKTTTKTSLVSTNARSKSATEVARLDDTSALNWASTQDRPETSSRPATSSPAPVNVLPPATTTSDAASPFGALSNPWTSSLRGAPPHSVFSLQRTPEN